MNRLFRHPYLGTLGYINHSLRLSLSSIAERTLVGLIELAGLVYQLLLSTDIPDTDTLFLPVRCQDMAKSQVCLES
jgi:hypothetical protein